MALINCPECNKEISDKAPTCPGCGAPLSAVADPESAGSGVKNLVTTQETSKKFKVQSIISLCLFFGGFLMASIVVPDKGREPGPMAMVPGTMIVVGVTWYIVNRFRIWWHHK